MKYRVAWSEIPLAIGAIVMLAASVLLMAQLILLEIKPGRPMKLAADLSGVVQPPEKLPLTLETFLNGSYQAVAARQLATYEPYFPTAVRLRNQLEYSIFDVLPVAQVVYGTDRELLDAGYIQDYCTRNLSKFIKTAPVWADKIQQMQSDVERNGQMFLYVITPSKIALYPEYLPTDLPCPALQQDRTQLIPAWTSLLTQKNVHFADTASILNDAKNNFPIPFYPHGGIHWNQIGSALGAQSIEAGIEAQRRDGTFTPFSFTWQMSSSPAGMDDDLAKLLNLFWLPQRYREVPHITITEAQSPATCRRVNIVIVGGSFMEAIGATLSELPCVAQVTEYFYWHTSRFVWADGSMATGSVDPAIRDMELRRAGILIYEENESLIGPAAFTSGPAHGQKFYQWLEDRK